MRIKISTTTKNVCAVGVMGLLSIHMLIVLGEPSLIRADDAGQTGEPTPPSGQTYIGTKQCASCHFDQFVIWKKDKHAKAFDILPAKYKTNAECLKCHTTGFGEPTGFKKTTDTHLAGISCESCHGPGNKHAEMAKPFANVAKLSPEQSKTLRDSIWKMTPQNICVTCHTPKAHKAHPKYDK